MALFDDAQDPVRVNAAFRLVLRRYGRQIHRQAKVAIPALTLPGVGEMLLVYAPPLIIVRLLRAFSENQQLSGRELVPYVATFAVLWLVGEAIWRVAGMMIARAEIRSIQALYIEAMDELLAKDLTFFHENFAGSLTKRALGYARRFEDFFDVLTFQVLSNILPVGFVAVVLWRYSPWLLVGLLGMLGLTVAIVFPLIRRRQRLVAMREAASNVLAGHVADSIANAETVRAFARESDESRIHAENVKDYGTKVLRSWDYQNLRVEMITAPMYVMTNTVGLIIALATSPGGGAGMEAVFITFSYYASFTRVMWEFNRIYRNLEGALTDAGQFAELLLDPPRVVDAPAPKAFTPQQVDVELRNVSFRYAPQQAWLFDRFSLRVEGGKKIGLVGRSGGGKTTLTRLLLRFMDVESGEIFLAGQRINDISQAALREVIGYVPQDPAMFHRTIADNIRVGRPAATDEQVRHAAILAHAAEFIDELPAGYDTLVGERGVKLSGGQRQRIAIARAILKDAPLLILDEATSSLDSESEQLIQDALWTLMARRTAIVIAHRLSTVRRMDELIVLERGQILEHGSHDELLARGGIYAGLWARQSGGFLPTSNAAVSARSGS